MSLSINQSNTMPSIGPTRVTADDIAQMVPEGYFATRQLASVTTNETTVEVTTTEIIICSIGMLITENSDLWMARLCWRPFPDNRITTPILRVFMGIR